MVPRQLGDEKIGRRIREELFKEEQSSAPDVQVEVRGGVAHLSGIVDVLAERLKAEEIARRVEGVRGVENRLSVSYDGRTDDKAIEAEIRRELEAQEETEGVGVKVERGVVTLLGRVQTLEQEWQATQTAQGVRGVREVVSTC
ncbi:MAG: BON domain-containing protein [Firmicutes bacterium]|nr:BON domain-containing protein [Bacillota bacterium]